MKTPEKDQHENYFKLKRFQFEVKLKQESCRAYGTADEAL